MKRASTICPAPCLLYTSTGTNGISVYYDSSVWSVCRMTEDATLGTVLELATADTADSEDYQACLLYTSRCV